MKRAVETYRSWGGGGFGTAVQQFSRPRSSLEASDSVAGARDTLAYGNGRSYGDVCLNPGGELIDCRSLDHFISFDRKTGVLVAETGVRLADILGTCCISEADGSAWFLPVTPGTRYVTLGGAIANDVHGKNHHSAGSFGRHVLSFDLARSDGVILTCSSDENAELFRATIGGLGLTGVILRAAIQLRRVPGTALELEEIRFGNLGDFFALSAASVRDWEYTAAWIDCVASGIRLGRGIYSRARHLPGAIAPPPPLAPRWSVPVMPRSSLIGGLGLRLFNAAYWRKLGGADRRRTAPTGYDGVFYPLDSIGSWNRLYGSRGFRQFQCVVPSSAAEDSVAEMLRAVAASGEGSMLAVLKEFGDLPSPGVLSFPMPGTTLALDFPERGEQTLRLLKRLEAIVVAAAGRIYPAKDSVMSADTFHAGYPQLKAFVPHIDPAFASGFARRVGLAASRPGVSEELFSHAG